MKMFGGNDTLVKMGRHNASFPLFWVTHGIMNSTRCFIIKTCLQKRPDDIFFCSRALGPNSKNNSRQYHIIIN